METRMQLPEFHRSRPNVDDKSVVFIPAVRRHQRGGWLEGDEDARCWNCNDHRILACSEIKTADRASMTECTRCMKTRVHTLVHVAFEVYRGHVSVWIPLCPPYSKYSILAVFFYFFSFFFIFQNISKSKLSFIFVSLRARRYLRDDRILTLF